MHGFNFNIHNGEKEGNVCHYKWWFQLGKSKNDLLYYVK